MAWYCMYMLDQDRRQARCPSFHILVSSLPMLLLILLDCMRFPKLAQSVEQDPNITTTSRLLICSVRSAQPWR